MRWSDHLMRIEAVLDSNLLGRWNYCCWVVDALFVTKKWTMRHTTRRIKSVQGRPSLHHHFSVMPLSLWSRTVSHEPRCVTGAALSGPVSGLSSPGARHCQRTEARVLKMSRLWCLNIARLQLEAILVSSRNSEKF